MSKGTDIDKLDKQILSILMRNAKQPYTDIAKQLFVSGGTIHVRMKKLEDAGVIERYTAVLNRAKTGFEVMAVITVRLEKHGRFPSQEFKEAIDRYPQILECWATTGDCDYILKVVTRDLNTFTVFLMDELLGLPIVASVKSSILLRQLKATTALPLDI